MSSHPEVEENLKTTRINDAAKHISGPRKPPKVGAELSTTRWTQGGGNMQTLPGTRALLRSKLLNAPHTTGGKRCGSMV